MPKAEAKKTVQIQNQKVTLTSLDKELWFDPRITKAVYIQYLLEVHQYMLPFMSKRPLTVIRYPHGVGDESFYQKNCPDYAPDFIQRVQVEGIDYIVCEDLPTLIWLGNQGALEFHIPSERISSQGTFIQHAQAFAEEIIFDLDPPDRSYFNLAVKAALELKELLDKLELVSFIKTSGNKGLQLYIPLPEQSLTFHQTRHFTEAIATFLVKRNPDNFTIERLKKNRGTRCYIDFLQHAAGKTIIAPYSPRGNPDALIATPLQWREVNEQLNPEKYSLITVKKRLKLMKCPFSTYWEEKKKQPLERLHHFLDKVKS